MKLKTYMILLVISFFLADNCLMAEHISNKPDVLSPRITIHTKTFQEGLLEKSPLIKNGKLNINKFWTIIHDITINCCKNDEEREALTKYPVEMFGSSLYLADEGWVDLELIGDIDVNIPSIKVLSSAGAIIDAKNRIHEALTNYTDEIIKSIRFNQELSVYVNIYTIIFNIGGETINQELTVNFGRRVKFYWDWYLSPEVREEVFDNDTVYQAQRYVEIVSRSQLPSSWLIDPELLKKFLKRVVFFTRLSGDPSWKKYRNFLRKEELDKEDFRSIAHTMRSIKEEIDNGRLNIFKMSHMLNILNPPQHIINPGDLSPQRTFYASLRQIFEKNSSIPVFPVKHSREIFKPGAIIFDFGSHSRLEWGYALLNEYPGITYLAVDLNDNFKNRISRLMKRRSLPKSQRNRLRFMHRSYLELFPENIGKADVITVNSPFCTTDFLNEVKKGYFINQLKRCIKPGGKIIIYTEWIESMLIKAYPAQYAVVSTDNARIVIKQVLEKAFGKENIYENSDPLPGYLPEYLTVYKNLQELRRIKQREEKTVEYKASFFMVEVPEQINDSPDINKEVVAGRLQAGLQTLKEMGVNGGNSRVVSINPGWPSEFEKLEKGLGNSKSLPWEWIAYNAAAEVVIVEPDERKNKRWQEAARHVKGRTGKITVIPTADLKEFLEEMGKSDIDAMVMHTFEGEVLLFNKKEAPGKLKDFLLNHVPEFNKGQRRNTVKFGMDRINTEKLKPVISLLVKDVLIKQAI